MSETPLAGSAAGAPPAGGGPAAGTGPANPAPVRPAVSVILVRDGADGLEVFVQHRVKTMDFAAGMVVYPGGRVDPADVRAAASAGYPDELIAAHERAWEASTLAAEGLGGGLADPAAAGAGAEAPSFAAVLLACAQRELGEETGAVIDPAALRPWANWTTPPGRHKRFDTYFYVARGAHTQVRHQTTEATDSLWMPTARILAERSAGRLRLMRPTLTLLMELDSLGSADAIMGVERVVEPVRPNVPISESDAHRPLD